MAQQDYKSRSRKSAGRSSRSGGSMGRAWMIVGTAMMLFAAFLFYLSRRPAPSHQAIFRLPAVAKHVQPRTGKSPTVSSQNTPAAPAKPKFDFYTLLPKLQVDVPKPPHDLGQSPAPSGTSGTSGTSAPSSNRPKNIRAAGRYMLQVASFGTAGQANVLKARLAFQGIVATVNPARVKNYTWYRVQIGPYSDLAKLNAMLTQLARQNIKPLVIKMNG